MCPPSKTIFSALHALKKIYNENSSDIMLGKSGKQGKDFILARVKGRTSLVGWLKWAVTDALRCLAKDARNGMISLRMDNTTAVVYTWTT